MPRSTASPPPAQPTDGFAGILRRISPSEREIILANPGPEGPGPIITLIANVAGSFPIPVTVVPGDLSDDDIDALS